MTDLFFCFSLQLPPLITSVCNFSLIKNDESDITNDVFFIQTAESSEGCGAW